MTAAPAAAEAAAPDTRRPTAHAWYSLVILALVYSFNNVDRKVVTLVFEPIKAEFGLSDGQLGLLAGLALGLPFAIAVVPLGVLVDRVNRRNMIAAVLFIWSSLTALAGAAQSYAMLVATRVVVGAAEAGSSPAAVSMISDMFPPRRRTGAAAIYQSGTTIGGLLCFTLGGWIVAEHGWRAAFLIAGLPGMALAILAFFTLKNPQRGAMDDKPTAPQPRGFGPAVRFILGSGVMLNLVFAPSLLSAGNTGLMSWAPSFLIRQHGLDVQQAGLAVAMSSGVGAAVGMLMSGFLSDRVTRGEPARILNVILVCLGLTIAAAVVFIMAPSTPVALAGFALYGMACYNFLGLGYGAVLNLTPAPLRGSVIAIELVASNLLGYAGGPAVVGYLSDAFGGEQSLRYALLTLILFYVWGGVHFAWARRQAGRMAGAT